MVLDIGSGEVRSRLDESGDVGGGQGQEALALEDVFDRLADEPRALGQFVDRHRAGLQPPGHGHDVVVLKVFPDARKVLDHRDPVLAQQVAGSDAR